MSKVSETIGNEDSATPSGGKLSVNSVKQDAIFVYASFPTIDDDL